MAEEPVSASGMERGQYYQALCSRCYEAGRSTEPTERWDAQWKLFMGHMHSGVNLIAEEAGKILDYLQASN